MRSVRTGAASALLLGLVVAGVHADDLKSGPEKKIGGSFTVKAFSGDNKGKELCYV
jgi:hypothetical protein